MKSTNKQKVLDYLTTGHKGTVSALAAALGIPGDSVRRILHELKNNGGQARKDRATGEWYRHLSGSMAHVAPEAEPEPVEPGTAEGEDANLDPTYTIFRVQAEGDTIYVKALNETDARGEMRDYFGEIPDSLVRVDTVDTLPEGEILINA